MIDGFGSRGGTYFIDGEEAVVIAKKFSDIAMASSPSSETIK